MSKHIKKIWVTMVIVVVVIIAFIIVAFSRQGDLRFFRNSQVQLLSLCYSEKDSYIYWTENIDIHRQINNIHFYDTVKKQSGQINLDDVLALRSLQNDNENRSYFVAFDQKTNQATAYLLLRDKYSKISSLRGSLIRVIDNDMIYSCEKSDYDLNQLSFKQTVYNSSDFSVLLNVIPRSLFHDGKYIYGMSQDSKDIIKLTMNVNEVKLNSLNVKGIEALQDKTIYQSILSKDLNTVYLIAGKSVYTFSLDNRNEFKELLNFGESFFPKFDNDFKYVYYSVQDSQLFRLDIVRQSKEFVLNEGSRTISTVSPFTKQDIIVLFSDGTYKTHECTVSK